MILQIYINKIHLDNILHECLEKQGNVMWNEWRISGSIRKCNI